MRNLPKSVAELQSENVTFELECIDRMDLNLSVAQLSSAAGVASYFRHSKAEVCFDQRCGGHERGVSPRDAGFAQEMKRADVGRAS